MIKNKSNGAWLIRDENGREITINQRHLKSKPSNDPIRNHDNLNDLDTVAPTVPDPVNNQNINERPIHRYNLRRQNISPSVYKQ